MRMTAKVYKVNKDGSRSKSYQTYDRISMVSVMGDDSLLLTGYGQRIVIDTNSHDVEIYCNN